MASISSSRRSAAVSASVSSCAGETINGRDQTIGRGPRTSFASRLFSFFFPDAPAANAARTLDWTCAPDDESRRYTDADRDLDDEVALDVHAQAQVQALARRLLEAGRGGQLVVLLRGGDAFARA